VKPAPEELPAWVRNGDGVVEAVDGGVLLHLRDDSLDWLAWRLLWLGVEFRVLEPVELVEVVATMGEPLRRATGS
jgi:predicted DNA-binding transcriptional regulator YafY